MEEEVFVYKPKRMLIGVFCVALIILLVGNIYLLLENNSTWLYLSLLVLTIYFVIFIFPVLKNQRIILSGKKMFLLTFGKKNKIDIAKDIDEVVVRKGEVVSYRFEKDGAYFQISPISYCDGFELHKNLQATLKRYSIRVREVSN